MAIGATESWIKFLVVVELPARGIEARDFRGHVDDSPHLETARITSIAEIEHCNPM